METKIILLLLAYLPLIAGLSVFAMRKQRQGNFLTEYFLGSRSMSGFVLAMTITYISASFFIGGLGAAYKFAILASLSLLVAFIGAMTVQFIGGARLLETASGISYDTGLLIFGGTIALYTAFSGFRASVLYGMQELVMLIGTFLLLLAVIHQAGELGTAVTKLRTIDPQLVSPEGIGNVINPTLLSPFAVLVCFYVIGLPHTAVRCISYKDSKAVHRGIIFGTIVMVVSGGRAWPANPAGSDDNGSRHPDAYDHRAANDGRRGVSRRADGGDHVNHQRAAAAILRYADQCVSRRSRVN